MAGQRWWALTLCCGGLVACDPAAFFPLGPQTPPGRPVPVDPGLVEPEPSEPEPSAAEPEPGEPEPAEPEPTPGLSEPVVLEPFEQRDGDPAAGLSYLVSADYVGCGLPASFVSDTLGLTAPVELRVEGRPDEYADVRYDYNVFVNEDGVELAAANCLSCHAAPLRGELVMGLGDVNRDWSGDIGPVVNNDLSFFFADVDERAAYQKWRRHMIAVADYVQVQTRGHNPADNLAAALFAHRDPDTLAWSDEPLLEPPPETPVPTDVPAWWLMAKKNAMLMTGAGRGDHSRIMMTASTLCVDDTVTAAAIYEDMDDVRAYIASLTPPPFPGPIDAGLAEVGEGLFVQHCASCHGTYGDHPSYPNLLVPVADVGTDPMLAQGAAQLSTRFVEWFNDSFYGETATLVPEVGYVAPPLDGVWATAPYFHNASVPRLSQVLHSPSRPAGFYRSFDADAYELDDPGWPVANGPADSGQFNTALPGHDNQGHTFADALDDADRDALLEYLKTL